MSGNRNLTFYPPPGGQLDLLAGLRAWGVHGGRVCAAGARLLVPFDPETHLEPLIREARAFDPTDLQTLQPIAEAYDVMLTLDAPWFTMGIQASSYNHADPPIMFWSFDPFLWGRGPGGPGEADAALLAFAREAGAAYVLADMGLGYEVIRHRFVRDGIGYRFVLPRYDPHRGHWILWVDICRELGVVEASGYVEAERITRPFGYIRHVLAGTDADVPVEGIYGPS